MNKYELQIQVTLNHDQGFGTGGYIAMDTLKVKGLSLFQVCVILGALQAVADEERSKTEPSDH